VNQSLAGNLPQHAAGIDGKTASQLGSPFSIEWAARLEVVRCVQDPADHVPLCEPHRVIANGVEHAAVQLPLRLGASGCGRPVFEARRTRYRRGPTFELLRTRIAERIVVPGAEGAHDPYVGSINTRKYAFVGWTDRHDGISRMRLLRWNLNR